VSDRGDLPACWVAQSRFDGRVASWHDCDLCEYEPAGALCLTRYFVVAAIPTADAHPHPGSAWCDTVYMDLHTDDRAEAEAAYARAEEWVRTGVLAEAVTA